MVQKYKLYLRYPNIYGKYYRSLTFICILYTKTARHHIKICLTVLIIKIISYQSNFLGSKFP